MTTVTHFNVSKQHETVLNRPIVSSAGSIIILINEPSASVVTSYEIKTNNCSQLRKRGMIHSASCMWTSSDTQTSFQERLLISASSFCWTSLAESDSLTASDVCFFVTSMTSERLSPGFCLLMAEPALAARRLCRFQKAVTHEICSWCVYLKTLLFQRFCSALLRGDEKPPAVLENDHDFRTNIFKTRGNTCCCETRVTVQLCDTQMFKSPQGRTRLSSSFSQ